MFFPLRFALAGALLLSGSGVCLAAPSLIPVPERASSIRIHSQNLVEVEAVGDLNKPRLNLDIHGADVVEVLGQIAQKGNLQLVVKSEVSGTLGAMIAKNFSPEKALQFVCQAAGLSCELRNGVWLISSSKVAPPPAHKPILIDNMCLKDVEVVQLFSIISTQFNVAIAFSGDVKGKIGFISLQNKTPREAIEIIALAVGATVKEDKNGAFIVSVEPQLNPVSATDPIAPQPLTPPIAQPHGGFLLLGRAAR